MESLCGNCRNNPEAKKPYVKMTYVKFTKKASKILEKVDKEGQNPKCYVCKVVCSFLKEAGIHGNDKN